MATKLSFHSNYRVHWLSYVSLIFGQSSLFRALSINVKCIKNKNVYLLITLRKNGYCRCNESVDKKLAEGSAVFVFSFPKRVVVTIVPQFERTFCYADM